MIIIPDVHGRTFWKTAVEQVKDNERIIFLGDYLDPYEIEKIDKIDTINNFIDILDYAKSHDNVTLLLGNHDFMYIESFMGCCRTDFAHRKSIRKLFEDNFKLFKIAEIDTVGENKYIFSHAPILKLWVDNNKIKPIIGEPLFDETDNNIETIVNTLNTKLQDKEKFLYLCKGLNNISWCRGGRADIGSCIWADVREIDAWSTLWKGYHSVFGHSQQLLNPRLELNWSCLDCRCAFRLTDDGEFNPITPLSTIYLDYNVF